MQDLPTPSASHGSPSDSGSSSSPKDTNDMALPFDFLMHEDTLAAPSFMQSNDASQGVACNDWANPGLWSQPTASEWTGWNGESTSSTNSSIESSLEMLNLLNGSLDAPSTLGFPAEANAPFPFSFNPTTALPPSTFAPPSLHFQTPTNGQEMTPASSPQISRAAVDRKRKAEDSGLSLDGEIAMRARQSAGVHEAVSASAAVARTSQFSAFDNKAPLPRLPPRPQTASRPAIVVKQPTPPSSHYSTSPSPPAEQLPPAPPPLLTASGRIKTPHTTIERRYRTNLNTRIQALKNAVPALRVVEARKTKGIEDPSDVVDSRGFVDGVKVARKSSKANVLGKAVEYIRVLKKREHRLKREADGLKTLLTGLVGGAGLLAEWERAWRDQYGGEEMDEVEGEAEEASDDDDQDSEDEKPKKKVKVSATEAVPARKKASPPPLPAATASVAPSTAADGLKRKRGRPRKVAPPTLEQPPPLQFAQQSQPATYLLATFLFFSFFKTPSNTTMPMHHHHSGSVLNPEPAMMSVPSRLLGFELTPQLAVVTETLHTLVSIFLLLSIILPFLPRTPAFLRNLALFSISNPEEAKEVGNSKSAVADPIVIALGDHTATQEINLRRSLGISANGGGPFSVLKAVTLKAWGAVAQLPAASPSQRKGWLRLGEIEVLKGENASFFPRMHTYMTFSRCISEDPSPTELAIAALLIGPIAPGSAQSLWSQAQALPEEQKTAIEQVALLVDFEEASNILAEVDGSSVSPLEIIASSISLDKIKQYVSSVFIRTVLGNENNDDLLDDEVRTPSSITDYKLYMEAAKDIGDKVGKIVTHVDHVVGSTSPSLSDSGISVSSDSDSESVSDGPTDDPALDSPTAKETMAILHALQLYQRLFPAINLAGSDSSHTAILSPPPSPSRRCPKTHPLRRALASPAFEGDADMEDARDRVIDLLNDLDARRRGVAFRSTS